MVKIAVCLQRDWADSRTIVERMARAQQIGPALTHVGVWRCGERGAMAAVTTEPGAAELIREGPDGSVLIVTGLPNAFEGEVRDRLDRIVCAERGEASQLMADLEGAYAAVLWHGPSTTLVVVTDILGMQPLYIARSAGLVLLASDVLGCAASGRIARCLDATTWGCFMTFGHALGDNTWLENVKRVQGGSILLYDCQSDRLTETRYWRWPTPSRRALAGGVDTAHLLHLLEREMAAYMRLREPRAILLSGGYDSRLILAVLRRMGVRPKALILANAYANMSLDGRYGAQIARLAGLQHALIRTDRDLFSSRTFLDFVVMSELSGPVLQLFVIQILGLLAPQMGAVWEGLFPGIVVREPNTHVEGGFDDYVSQFPIAPFSPRWVAATRVFSPAFLGRARTGLDETVRRERQRYSNDALGVRQFIVRNRTRNQVALNPLKVYPHVVPIFTPGIGRELWELTAALPHATKAGFRLYSTIFSRHFPEMLRVPFCSANRLYRPKRYSPRHELSAAAVRLQALARRLSRFHPLRRLGIATGGYFHPSRFLKPVVQAVTPDDPDLNGDGVRRVQRALAGGRALPPESGLLFYWQVARWLMREPERLYRVARASEVKAR